MSAYTASRGGLIKRTFDIPANTTYNILMRENPAKKRVVMIEKLARAFRAYLANGKSAEYGIAVTDVSTDLRTISLTLTFKSAARYCCAEPGCHMPLHDTSDWRRLHHCFEMEGATICKPLTIQLHGIVERGAFLTAMRSFNLPEYQEGFEYRHVYHEPVG